MNDKNYLSQFSQHFDFLMNFGRGSQCFFESVFTSGKARLPRLLKKATKKYLLLNHLSSMVIKPQNQFVCLKKDGHLFVCHSRY